MAAKKGGLGRGLESLFDQNSTEQNSTVIVNINDIEPNRNQPRKHFDEDALSELAESISRHGLIQPIVVRPTVDGTYTIIAGERRWRACRLAGMDEVPVIVKEADDLAVSEMALIENLQREDLNPVEEAYGYKALIDKFSLTQEEVAQKMSKSRSAVTNALRLLNLNPDELEALRDGRISAGHARALLAVEHGDTRTEMFKAALSGASVRELEKMAKAGKGKKRTAFKKPTFYEEVELSLKNELRRKISVKPSGKGKGTLTVEFFSDEELKSFAKKLAGEQSSDI